MKKILSLFALVLMSCMGAWATDYLKASTDGNWEHQYRLHARNQSGNYWLTAGLHSTTDKANAGNFAFVSTGTAGQYYIYSVGDSKWLTYSDATNGANKIELSSDQGAYFVLAYGNATGSGAINNSYGAKDGYTIKASSATEYMNFYQGPDSNNYLTTGRIGFWQQAFDDAGSIWVLESVEDYFVNFDKTLTVSTRQIQHIRLGDDTKDLTATQNQEYRDLHETIVFEVTKGAVVQPGITINGSWTHGMVYVDWNKNNRFDWEVSEPELVATSTLTGSPDLNTSFGNLTVPADIEAGDYRMRFKTDWVGGVEAGKSPAGRIGDDGTLTTSTKNGIVSNSGCIVDVTLRVKNEISTEQINIVQNRIDEIMTAIYADAIGYPDRHNATNTPAINNLADFKSISATLKPVTAENYAEALAALNSIYTLTAINFPKDGKAYVFTNVATDKTKHYLYENTESNKLLWADRGTGTADELPANGKYVCRVNGGYFTFVNEETGHYLIWRGSDTGYNSAKGYEAEYNNEDCRLFVERPIYNSGNMGNVTSQQELFGWVCFGGKRDNYNGIDKCFLYSNGTDHFNQDTGHVQRYGSGHSSMFAIEEVSFPYTTKTLNDGGDGKNYATVALPYAMEIPAGVKAYTAKDNGNVLTLTDATENSQNVPAGAYILVSESATSAAVLPAAANPAAVDNDLRGSITTVPSGSIYVLNKTAEEGVGFYKFNGDNNTLLGKAYLPSDAAANKLAFRFEDVVTAISAIEGNGKNVEIFDLQGRRLNKAQKGMNIINGHKVLVK